MSTSKPIQLLDQIPKTSLSEVFDLVDRTAKNLRRIQRLTVSEVGLTPSQFAVLHLLWEQDERPIKDLAAAFACTRATMTGIMDSLERKALVARKPNPADRRSLLASLTDKGQQLQQSSPSLENIYNNCCDGLTPLEFQQLGFLLSKLNDSLTYPEER